MHHCRLDTALLQVCGYVPHEHVVLSALCVHTSLQKENKTYVYVSILRTSEHLQVCKSNKTSMHMLISTQI